VFGVGGVGSFAAEGLVRSGVGRVILVDYDRICVTNVNRQVHALKGTLGKPKVHVMAELTERFDAVVFAKWGAARLEERLGRDHQDAHGANDFRMK
jgi:tRNA A37 threonylcarbamoyladenosine dehydratase